MPLADQCSPLVVDNVMLVSLGLFTEATWPYEIWFILFIYFLVLMVKLNLNQLNAYKKIIEMFKCIPLKSN